MFGAWFEEVLTLGDQQIENISSKTLATNVVDLDKSVIDASNYSIVPESDDPEAVRKITFNSCINISINICTFI